MDNITWHNGYHPGRDTIILRYDNTTKSYKMTFNRDYPPNEPYKGDCIQHPLKQAIETHGAALAEKFKYKELRFALVTEDFAINWRGNVEVLGGVLDIGNTGFQAKDQERFVFLHEQCLHKAAIHTAGFSYSAGLKYKLACAQLVLHFDSKYKEFYEPALEDGVHMVRVPAMDEGVEEEEFFDYSAPKIKKVVEAALSSKTNDLPSIAAAGQQFALTQLSPEGLSCYWYGALLKYGELYFTEQTEAQKRAFKEQHAIEIETDSRNVVGTSGDAGLEEAAV
ncbi:hypothetical protein KSW81_003201 [Nannochloris sp. 'desiccata']|nr:hypothetical protein KSW81_003201 [Chlorella desiccata (nom. nud.)]